MNLNNKYKELLDSNKETNNSLIKTGKFIFFKKN